MPTQKPSLVRIRAKSKKNLSKLVEEENRELPPQYKEITQEDFLSDLIDSQYKKMTGVVDE